MSRLKTQALTLRDIRRETAKFRSKIPDEVLFTSSAFVQLLNTMAMVVTRRIKSRISCKCFYNPKSRTTAYTDGNRVVVNAGFEKIKRIPSLYQRSLCVTGMAAHELAHCLLTNFNLIEDAHKAFLDGEMYLGYPTQRPENRDGIKGAQEYLASGKLACAFLSRIWNHVDNIVEDGYIEVVMSRAYPGSYAQGLDALNDAMFGENMFDRLQERYEEENKSNKAEKQSSLNAFLVLMSEILHFAKLHELEFPEDVTCYSEPVQEVILLTQEHFEHMRERLSRDIYSPLADVRHQLVRDILLENWDLLEPNLKSQEDMEEEQERMKRFLELLRELLPLLNGSEQAEADENSIQLPGVGLNSPNHPDNRGASLPGSRPESDDENTFQEIQSILNEMAEEKAENALGKELLQMLQENASESQTEDDNYYICIERPGVTDEGKERYKEVWPSLRGASKKLEKRLMNVLHERRKGTVLRGQPMGRRMCEKDLYRKDECYFVKKKLPNDCPTIAVSILLDGSGSMGCGGNDTPICTNNAEGASNTALILYEFCVALGFPVMVCTHDAESKNVNIRVQASFQRVDKNDRYRIAVPYVEHGNRDGTAIGYCLKELSRRSEDVKFLFILSDGLPSDYRGGYEEGKEHIQHFLKQARRNNVRVYASALEDSMKQICDIYGENTFDITDISRLPKILLNLIRKQIL